jgi:hypothetical protein
MKVLLAILCCAIAVSTIGCATGRPPFPEVSLPPQPFLQKGYSLVPLDAPGWLIGYRDSEKLVLGKPAADPDENSVIRASTQVLPPLKSEEEFMGFSKSVLVMEGATRYKMLSQETKLLTIKDQPCVRTDTVMEDHGAVKRSSRTDLMILEAYSVLCKHPNNSIGILVAYSHRYYAANKDLDSPNKAQKIFDSIAFSNY